MEPKFNSVQSLSRVRLFATPWIAARQASLSITNSWVYPKSIESVMPSSHLILCCPRLLLPPVPPSIRGHESRQIGSGQTGDARVNVSILGIRELKWTGMGEFNSDDHYIYYGRRESLRRNGVTIMDNKRVWNAVHGISKMTEWSLFFSKANHSISQ